MSAYTNGGAVSLVYVSPDTLHIAVSYILFSLNFRRQNAQFRSYLTENTLYAITNINPLVLYRDITGLAAYYENRMARQSTLCWHNTEILVLNLVLLIVTTGL